MDTFVLSISDLFNLPLVFDSDERFELKLDIILLMDILKSLEFFLVFDLLEFKLFKLLAHPT